MAYDDLELPSGSFPNVVGGSATYAAIASSLFAPTRVVGVVGNDFSKETLSALGERKVDLSGVEHADGLTFRWKGRYSENLRSRDTLDTQLNVFADFKPQVPESFRKSTHVLLGNIHPSLQLDVLSQLENPAVVAADTMNFWISSALPELKKVLAKVDTLIINDEELAQLSEEHNLSRGARAVRAMGPKRLVVKRGDAGSLLFDDEGVFVCPAYPLETEVDPTGCGDTFAGAVLGYLAREGQSSTRALRHSLLIGSTVASFCVEGVGNEKTMKLTMPELLARFEKLRHMLVH